MEDTGATKEKIKSFLSRYVKKRNLQDNDDFFALGVINSLLAMQLVMFVEKEFKIKVEKEDLDLKNFSSIHALSNFVGRKTGTAGGSAALQ